jgi:transposase
LAQLHRAGELTGVWVPDATHEAVRMPGSTAAAGIGRWRIGSGWPKQSFDHTAQRIVFQEAIDAIEDAAQRLRRLEQQLVEIVPTWSMAPVVDADQAMRARRFWWR